MKYFIITIDTEGDNLWNWREGDEITTQNTLFLERFQHIANRYGFKPVWLTNYEMIQDKKYLEFINLVLDKKAGELGMHLHAWNTPPYYKLEIRYNNAPYLIEYPVEIMEEKLSTMTRTIESLTGTRPYSHRAGRWAMDERYFHLLEKYGYKIDCSVTPYINWTSHLGQTINSKGSDYSKAPTKPYFINNIFEVPVTIIKSHSFQRPRKSRFKEYASSLYHVFTGNTLWLRPTGNNLNNMVYIADRIYDSDSDYIMFMIHSSELMPGGSPTFKTENDISELYTQIDSLFNYIHQRYTGITLTEYYNLRMNDR
jgi:hypothetical protein